MPGGVTLAHAGPRVAALTAVAARFRVSLAQRTWPLRLAGSREVALVALFADLGFRRGAEIGVEAGVFAETLCRGVPGLTLLCVDPWAHYPGAERYRKPAKHEAMHDAAVARLAPYDCRLLRLLSEDAAPLVPDGSLDFVYVDGNHSADYVWRDIKAWERKVRAGGVVAGHDFMALPEKYNNGTVQAVTAHCAARGIAPWFVMEDPAIRPGTRFYRPTWFWVR